jgi:hypothetical protein
MIVPEEFILSSDYSKYSLETSAGAVIVSDSVVLDFWGQTEPSLWANER